MEKLSGLGLYRVTSSYENYSQAEILLDVTLDEVIRRWHQEHIKTAPMSTLLGGWQYCQAFPCRMVAMRAEEAAELINERRRQVG
jgi:hypothetical protein